jgi:hypothetical protein
MKLSLSLLALLTAASSAFADGIVCANDAPAQVKLAAKEVRRYAYLRTGTLLNIAPEAEGKRVVLKLDTALAEQEYRLKTEGETLVISGGTPLSVLYGAYALAEKWGVRFQIDGDVIPDRKIAFALPQLDETKKPLFRLRGLQPFHDFPEGPDWWTTDDWKGVVSQTVKMRMNFIGLHTYPSSQPNLGPEPTVWIGLPEDVNEDGTVKTSPTTGWYTTAKFMPYGCYAPGTTGEYSFGAAQLYPTDNYGSEVTGPDDYPMPKTPEAAVALTNRTGRMLNEVFGMARRRGVTTALGTESPLSIPDSVKAQLKARGMNPDSQETRAKLYEGMFLRIKRAHPADYYWIWGHEGEIDRKTFIQNILDARKALAAQGDPFGLAVCGWGWMTGNFPALDTALPKEVAFSAINATLGTTPVSPNFAKLKDRSKWAIPWMEDDAFMASLQLRAGRTRRDAVDARAYGCDGLFGIHWRTRIMSPNLGALAAAGWEQGDWSRPIPAKGATRDVAVSGGTTATYLNDAVEGAVEMPLYQTMRQGAMRYDFTLPDGAYKVMLRFSEPVNTGAGVRVFGVNIQGQKRLEHFDIAALAGRLKALDRSFDGVEVKGGKLTLEFVPEKSDPLICAIEIAGAKFSKKINCGGRAHQDYEADASADKLPRDLPTKDFYEDWATAQFGPEIGVAAAAVFTRLDGRFPTPTGWLKGPGAVAVNRTPWNKVAGQYAFVDTFASLRPKVSGRAETERFDWWLDALSATRAMGRAGCLRGELDAAMAKVVAEKDPAAKAKLAREKALPLRLSLLRACAEINEHLMATVRNQSELGTITNIEQQTMKRTKLLTGRDAELAAALGAPLPPDAMPWKDYRGKPLLTPLTARGDAAKGEALVVPILALAKSPVKSVVVKVRPLGSGEWKTVPAAHVARALWKARLPASSEDFEYTVEAVTSSGETLRWPASAPDLPQTVIVE